MADIKETGTCCLCGKEYSHFGNNPWPLTDKEDDRCCDECNDTKVIPARISRIANKNK